MAPTARTQSGCSTDAKNNNPYPRGQIGLPRNRLGNKIKKPILSEQNQIAPKPLLNRRQRDIQNEISKSTPNLSVGTKANRVRNANVGVMNNSSKIKSLENLEKTKKNFIEINKAQVSSRIPIKLVNLGKLPNEVTKKTKRIEVSKKTGAENSKSRTEKAVENKRKLNCVENIPGHSKQKITSKELLSPTDFSYSLSSFTNRMEECVKVINKISLVRKMEDGESGKRSSSDFDDSIKTFNSDEISEMLANDFLLKFPESTMASNDLGISDKRNSREFDDPIGSLFSYQTVMSKSNEFLNLGGSKSVPEGLDNITPGLSELSNVIDRTPSAEDLPMECEAEPESATSVIPGPENNPSARSTSPTEELPQESLFSRTTNAGVSTITSITSIMSLDTGYQGDGELSRPESRNTENEPRLLKLPIAENGIPVKTINFDDGKTMTDSDFFTESDADVHDDLSAAAAEIGSGKGDRKAQVIDGTLYGGAFIQAHVATRHEQEPDSSTAQEQVPNRLAGNSEDMESSGIYSDLEKKPEEVAVKEPISYMGLITEQMKTIQNLAMSVAEGKFKQETLSEGIVKSSSAESSSTIHEVVSVKTSPTPVPSTDKAPTQRKEVAKKPQSRTTTPKIKAFLETSNNEDEPRVSTVKKGGKWNAVMDKIAQSKEENKYTPSKFRNIKSKVFQNIGPLFNSRKPEPEVKSSSRVSPGSQTKARSRRSTRVRSSESSLVSPKSKLSRTSASPNSSQRSSLSDISLSGNSHQKSTNRDSKKRDSISPPSNESTNSTNTPTRKLNNNDENVSTANRVTPNRNSDLQNGNVVQNQSAAALATMKTPTVRKTPIARKTDPVGPNLHRTSSVPLKDSNQNGIAKTGSTVIITNNNHVQNNNKVKTTQSFQNKTLKTGTRGSNPVQVKNGCLLAVAKETKKNEALLKQLKHNSRAFESLAVLFSYCINDLDAFSAPQLKEKLENEKSKFTQAQSDLHELQSRLLKAREESENFEKLVKQQEEELKIVTEQKCEAESELLKECENIRYLRRELSDRIEKFENEKDSLECCLSEAKKENKVLKSANLKIKEEYDKCLEENQRLVELVNKRENEVRREEKENLERENHGRVKRSESKEPSPHRLPGTPVGEKSLKGSFVGSPVPNCLESEVESLRQVLALKTDEVTELRRQELSLREKADRVPKLLSNITILEGKVEDLQTQLSSQTEMARDLFKSNYHLEEELKSVNIQKTHLTQKVEELQYKLKQYAEAMQQLANQKNFSEKNFKIEFSPIKSKSPKVEGNMDDSTKSHMKAVVEKSDSVSYMLGMTEDSTEIVTNIIKRAESLRSSNRDNTLPKKKRTKPSLSTSSDTNRASYGDNFRPENTSTPNLSPNKYEFDRHMAASQRNVDNQTPATGNSIFPGNKVVKLSQNDFSTDLIELPQNSNCEVIEITKNFDKADKNGEMVTSTSSNSSSSSNGSHFDIEADVFCSVDNNQADEDTENSEVQENDILIRKFGRENENIQPVLPVYKDIEQAEENPMGDGDRNHLQYSNKSLKIPKVSGGEAMIGFSSDDEEIRIGNE